MKTGTHKKLTILGIFAAFLLLIGAASALSAAKLGVADPFVSAGGLWQILFTDKEYVTLSHHPKIMLAKPDASLAEYMESRGLYEDPDARMGGLRVFANAISEEYVFDSINGYFAKWQWKE